MNIEKNQKISYFKIWEFLTFKVFRFKLVQLSIFCITLGFVALWLFQTFLFCHKANVTYFIQYGPMYFTSLYLILCMLSLYSTNWIWVLVTRSIDSWNVPRNEEVESSYEKELFRATVYMSLVIFFGLVTAVFFVIPTEEDKSFDFIVFILKEYFWFFEKFVEWPGRFCFIPVTYIGMVQPNLRIMFPWVCLKYHTENCLFCLKRVAASHSDEEVARNLKFCLWYHARISRTLQFIIKSIQMYFLPFQVVGTLLFINILVYYFWMQDSLSTQYPRIFSLAVTAFLTLYGLAKNGQEIEDLSEKFFEVLEELEWYDWNNDNKKMYLICLMNMQKPLKIKFSENISLNYKMGAEMLKTFFSYISVMRKLHK